MTAGYHMAYDCGEGGLFSDFDKLVEPNKFRDVVDQFRSMEKIKLIDGEIGTQILRYEEERDGDPLWCSRFNKTHPDAVYKCYMDFLRAGSDLIRTNTYQATVAGFKEYLQLSDLECEELFHDIVKLARKAKEAFLAENEAAIVRPIEIWASVGSYGAYLHDGSEYTGLFVDTVSSEAIKKLHMERLKVLLNGPAIDGVAVETIPSLIEAKLIVDIFNEYYPDVKYWISFQCKVSLNQYYLIELKQDNSFQDEKSTAKGEAFDYAAEVIWNSGRNSSQIVAVGVNCLDPKARMTHAYVIYLYKD